MPMYYFLTCYRGGPRTVPVMSKKWKTENKNVPHSEQFNIPIENIVERDKIDTP